MSGKTLGFGQVPVTEQKESLQILHALVDQEIGMLSGFDQLLHQEITSVERAKKNAAVLVDKIASVEKLLKRRDLFYLHLSNETVKPESQINVDDCSRDLQALGKLDSAIGYALSDLDIQLQKLFINDVHDVYAKEENSREILKKIDAQMRELYARIHRINQDIKSSSGFLESVSKRIMYLRTERASAAESKNIVGFGNGRQDK